MAISGRWATPMRFFWRWNSIGNAFSHPGTATGARSFIEPMPAALSVVLVNKFGFDRLRRLFLCLAEQSIACQLELVVV